MKTKKIILALFLSGMFVACNKPDVGYFSYGGIQMQEDTLQVIRGLYQYSSVPMIDGSSRPLTFKIIRARHLETGEIVPNFTEGRYEVTLWNQPFNAITDTTMELVNAKRVIGMIPPVLITENSGIISFNSATSKFPIGKYGIDVEVSNSKGSEIITNFCSFNLQSVPFKLGQIFRDRFLANDNKEEALKEVFYLSSYENSDLELIMQGKHPRRKIYKAGESDIFELEMIVKDCYGHCISPRALKPMWSSKGFYRNTYEVNSIAMDGYNERYTYTDTSAIYRFPTCPYPAYNVEYPKSDDMYKPMVVYKLDQAYYTLTEDMKKKALDKGIGVDFYEYQFYHMVTFNEPGKWKLEVTVPEIIGNGKR